MCTFDTSKTQSIYVCYWKIGFVFTFNHEIVFILFQNTVVCDVTRQRVRPDDEVRITKRRQLPHRRMQYDRPSCVTVRSFVTVDQSHGEIYQTQ